MSEGQACCSKHPKRDKAHRLWSNFKSSTKLKLHGLWMGFLFKIKLGRAYQKMLCRLNLYRKFPDGRCHWCGKYHDTLTHDRFLG